jgi:tetratricopeptide (TPR) repeat protein
MFQKMDKKRLNVRYVLLAMFVLVIATGAVYLQVKNYDFVSFDDNAYITENRHVQTGLKLDNVVWAFTAFHVGNWHPLTWISHMLDCQLFGLKPGLHHLVNLFFHVANTILLFLILHRMTNGLWQSAFVAAIFAIHPLHVESVAWLAERKDVLSTFFWMLTMGAYVFYVEKPELKRYFLALLFFALGLMAKPMLVTLPFVFLLLDYWPLRRLSVSAHKQSENSLKPRHKKKERRKSAIKTERANTTETQSRQEPLMVHIVREKVPFFVLSLASSVITYMAQGGAVGSLQSYPLPTRIANALVSYCAYIWKAIWPAGLAVLYPHPGIPPAWEVFGAVFFLAVTTFLIFRTMKYYPYLTTGWFWYLGTLVPVIGLVQVGVQAMADRYTYVPLIGVSIMVAWGGPELLKKWRHRNAVLATLAFIILSSFSFLAWKHVQYWQNSVTLFKHTLAVTANNALILNNMGKVLEDQGRIDEALKYYNKAIEVNTRFYLAYENRGNVKIKISDYKGAISDYDETLRINPYHADGHYNLGNALAHQGKMVEAAAHLKEAVRLKPRSAEYHNNLGYVLALQGKEDEAINHFREAIRLKPDLVDAHNNLGNALLHQRRLDEAIDSYREALRINPDFKLAKDNLKNALATHNKKQ